MTGFQICHIKVKAMGELPQQKWMFCRTFPNITKCYENENFLFNDLMGFNENGRVCEEQKPRAQFRFSAVINSRWMQELGGVCVKPDGRVKQFREITASVAALRAKVCAAVGVDPADPGVGPPEGWGAVLKKLQRENTEITKLPQEARLLCR